MKKIQTESSWTVSPELSFFYMRAAAGVAIISSAVAGGIPSTAMEPEFSSSHNLTIGVTSQPSPFYSHSAPPMSYASGDALDEAAETTNAVAELRDISGLTTKQISRLFGVSPRSIFNWINGKSMTASNTERAQDLLDQIQAIPAASAEERAEKIMRVANGTSHFRHLLSSAPGATQLQTPAISVSDRLGV